MRKPGYTRGANARRAGARIDDCPYDVRTKFATNWCDGWCRVDAALKRQQYRDSIGRAVRYVIYSKRDGTPMLPWGLFPTLREARTQRTNMCRPKLGRSLDALAYGICKFMIEPIGRTW